MCRATLVVIVAWVLAIGGLAEAASGAEDPPEFWAVTGVSPSDVLHLRDVPSADSKSLAQIPPNARGLKHLGCRRNQPSLDLWVRMSEAARRDAQTQWCRVEYQGREGWVAGRYLKKDGAPGK